MLRKLTLVPTQHRVYDLMIGYEMELPNEIQKGVYCYVSICDKYFVAIGEFGNPILVCRTFDELAAKIHSAERCPLSMSEDASKIINKEISGK